MTTGRGPTNSRDALRAMPNRESAGPELAAHKRALRTLSPDTCFDLLEPGGIGRVGFMSADGIMMLPVNFAVTGKTIIFRTAPDTLLALYAMSRLSVEADRYDEALHEGWSVLAQGHAHKVTMSVTSGIFRTRRTSSRGQPGTRDVYVRITPTRISGRYIEQRWVTSQLPGSEPGSWQVFSQPADDGLAVHVNGLDRSEARMSVWGSPPMTVRSAS